MLARPVCFTLAAGLFSASAAHAIDASKALAFTAGPVTIRPHLSLAEVYDDNVFYMPRNLDASDDFITVANIGASFSLGREVAVNPWMDFFEKEANFVTMDYMLSHLDYLQINYLDTDNHAINIRDRFKGNRLALKGSDRLAFTTGLIGGGTTYRQKVKRMLITDNYLLEYDLSERTRFYLNGLHNTTDYQQGTPFYDITTWQATGGFGYRPFTKTSFFGEVHYGQSLPSPNRNDIPKGPSMDFIGGYLGVQGKFTERLTGMLKAGYETRSYSDGSPAPASPVLEASINHRFRQNTVTTLALSHQDMLSAEYAGTTYTSDVISLRVDQRFGATGRFLASAGGSVQMADYGKSPGLAGRTDTSYRINADFTYLVKQWLQAGLSYEFEMFDSSSKGVVDYDANRVTLKIAIGY
jgi:hypothetical protein